MTKVVAISTNKGGVLKTTTTTNIAGILSKENKILLIDMDNQGNIALSFGKNPDEFETTVYDVLISGEDPKKAIVKVHENIDILPANDDMTFYEHDIFTNIDRYPNVYTLLRDAVKPIASKYDYILIDTAPNLGIATGAALTYADEVIIPFQPEGYSIRSLQKVLKAINEIKELHNTKLSIAGVLATMVQSNTTAHANVLQQCRQYCEASNIRLFDSVIPRSIRFANSILFEGLPATMTDTKDKSVFSYIELVKELGY